MNNTTLTAVEVAQACYSKPALEDHDHPFVVGLWGSHPDAGNDDLHTTRDFPTAAQAMFFMNNPWAVLDAAHALGLCKQGSSYYRNCTPYLELDFDGGHVIARTDCPERKRRDDRSADRREAAMQAGMMGGIDAYNDAMGY